MGISKWVWQKEFELIRSWFSSSYHAWVLQEDLNTCQYTTLYAIWQWNFMKFCLSETSNLLWSILNFNLSDIQPLEVVYPSFSASTLNKSIRVTTEKYRLFNLMDHWSSLDWFQCNFTWSITSESPEILNEINQKYKSL